MEPTYKHHQSLHQIELLPKLETALQHSSQNIGIAHELTQPIVQDTASSKSKWQTIPVSSESGNVVLGGIQIQQILSAELFREANAITHPNQTIASLCQTQWQTLTQTIATLPTPLEGLLILENQPQPENIPIAIAFLAIGRGETPQQAQQHCWQSCETLWQLLSTTLNYLDIQPLSLEDPTLSLSQLAQFLHFPHVLEIQRQWEALTISHREQPILQKHPLGFQLESTPSPTPSPEPPTQIRHLFPWHPSDDSWNRLLSLLQQETHPTAIVVHFQNHPQAPTTIQNLAYQNLAIAEKMTVLAQESIYQGTTILQEQLTLLKPQLLQRISILQNPTIAARIFITGAAPIPDALQATLQSSLYHPSPNDLNFQAGVTIQPISHQNLLSPLNTPELPLYFSPAEAIAFLRTPMPTETDLPGIPVKRSRTAPITGQSGTDCPLGTNRHRNQTYPIALDTSSRFRHTYIVGQTGTGKSTLLQNMILHDIHQNRGIAVLDPHGELIQGILEHFPKHRTNDLILVDVTDTERPIGFNPLKIDESDPLKYRIARDLIIDDLYAFLDRTYDMRKTGGPRV